MPARKKSLRALVHDRSFLARRHAHLLETDNLVDDPALRALQVAYRVEESDLEKRALALRFQKLTRQVEQPRPTLRQGLLAGIGPDAALAGELRASELRVLAERWEGWDAHHGYAWRVRHDLMHNGDIIEAHWRLSGRHKAKRNLDRIHEQFPDLRERALAELGREPKPRDPPGWKFVA